MADRAVTTSRPLLLPLRDASIFLCEYGSHACSKETLGPVPELKGQLEILRKGHSCMNTV